MKPAAKKASSQNKNLIRHTSTISKAKLLVFVLIFGAIGGYIIYKSFAAGPAVVSVPGIAVRDYGNITPTDLARYGVVVTDGQFVYDNTRIQQIHSASPNTKVLDYVSSISVNTCGSTQLSRDICNTGVSKEDANTIDSTWLLKDASGNLLVNKCYQVNNIGDIGSTTYQNKWIANVVARVHNLGFDGVFIDDVVGDYAGFTGTANPAANCGNDAVPAKYPTRAAWQTAVKKFIDSVGPALQAQNIYVVANAHVEGDTAVNQNQAISKAAWWTSISPSLNGLTAEYWEQKDMDGNGSYELYNNNHGCDPWCYMGYWDAWMNKLFDASQGMNGDFYAWTYQNSNNATNAQRNRIYGRASFLLRWDGGGGAYLVQNGDKSDPWNPDWTTDIGTPAETNVTSVGTGAFQRKYTKGMVVVNPTLAAQTIQLGATYIDTKSNVSVSSVYLGPTSAAILSSPNPPPAGFTNNILPVLSGAPKVGQTLSVTSGSWTPTPANYYYVWHRCDSTGNNCVQSPTTANQSTYTVTSGDVGYYLTVQVAPESDWYSALDSNLSAIVVAAIPGDANGDGHVTQGDLTILAANFGTSASFCDFNHDGMVSFLDVSIVLSNFGR